RKFSKMRIELQGVSRGAIERGPGNLTRGWRIGLRANGIGCSTWNNFCWAANPRDRGCALSLASVPRSKIAPKAVARLAGTRHLFHVEHFAHGGLACEARSLQ